MKSFKMEVQADHTGTWAGNAIRLQTKEQAQAYLADLTARWISVRAGRVVESDDPVNYAFLNGTLTPVGEFELAVINAAVHGGK